MLLTSEVRCVHVRRFRCMWATTTIESAAAFLHPIPHTYILATALRNENEPSSLLIAPSMHGPLSEFGCRRTDGRQGSRGHYWVQWNGGRRGEGKCGSLLLPPPYRHTVHTQVIDCGSGGAVKTPADIVSCSMTTLERTNERMGRKICGEKLAAASGKTFRRRFERKMGQSDRPLI